MDGIDPTAQMRSQRGEAAIEVAAAPNRPGDSTRGKVDMARVSVESSVPV